MPSSAKIGSTRASKLPKHWCQDTERHNAVDSDECSLSSGTLSSGCHTSESGLEHSCLSFTKQNHRGHEDEVKESDILSDEDDFCESKSETLTDEIEVEFEKMQIDTKAALEQVPSHQTDSKEAEQIDHPHLRRSHFSPIKRKSASAKKNKGNLLAMHKHDRSLDSQSDGANVDLNSILEREFSIQSLTSAVNEECFYENIESNGVA